MTDPDEILSTLIGPLRVRFDRGGALTSLRFPLEGEANPAEPPSVSPAAQALARQLEEYFAGRRERFEVTLAPEGTAFQRAVWEELVRIPPGTTASYGEIARRIGRPKAVRAVAQACGANPLPIVIPCHRVIGADGSLTGFGGGVALKRRLLVMEGSLHGALFRTEGETSR
jgi:methylated-DNA-[protein]-cysteine S-methyltransferase